MKLSTMDPNTDRSLDFAVAWMPAYSNLDSHSISIH
jgi:hypothetical protein